MPWTRQSAAAAAGIAGARGQAVACPGVAGAGGATVRCGSPPVRPPAATAPRLPKASQLKAPARRESFAAGVAAGEAASLQQMARQRMAPRPRSPSTVRRDLRTGLTPHAPRLLL